MFVSQYGSGRQFAGDHVDSRRVVGCLLETMWTNEHPICGGTWLAGKGEGKWEMPAGGILEPVTTILHVIILFIVYLYNSNCLLLIPLETAQIPIFGIVNALRGVCWLAVFL